VVLVIQVVRHAKALSDLAWALASGLGLAALLWIGSFVIELYKAPIKIDSQQQESLAALQSKVGSTKVASWEPGFEKQIRAQLKLTIPEVRRLLHHLIVYGQSSNLIYCSGLATESFVLPKRSISSATTKAR